MIHLPECRHDLHAHHACPNDRTCARCDCRMIVEVRQGALLDAISAVRSVYVTTDAGETLRQGGSWENALDRAIEAIKTLEE